LDVIPYFEQTLVQLREFIKNIKMKEPTLQWMEKANKTKNTFYVCFFTLSSKHVIVKDSSNIIYENP
jgi:hypothetical protein